jgi:hypothetical protein
LIYAIQAANVVNISTVEHHKVVPLYCKRSQTKKEVISAHPKIKEVVNKVIVKTATADTWAIDKAGDCHEIIEHFTGNKLKIFSRLKLKRYI